jgi:dihydroorotate dehydrogenase electron transfer subunit
MVWLPGLDEKPFSLLDHDPIAFTIAAVGPLSRALHTLGPGDKLWLRGPLGTGFALRPDNGGGHLMVGGGYGVAPLLFLAKRAAARGERARAVIGARTAAELLLVEQFEQMVEAVALTTEDGTAGQTGVVTDAVRRLLDSDPPDALYACGPHGMLHALQAQCRSSSLPAQLSWEAYMRCGIGLCGSCEHEGRLVCTDGPVLYYAEPTSESG